MRNTRSKTKQEPLPGGRLLHQCHSSFLAFFSSSHLLPYKKQLPSEPGFQVSKTLVSISISVLVALVSILAGAVPMAHSAEVVLDHVRTFKTGYAINRLVWHPNNKELAVGQNLNKQITIWDADAGRVIRTLDNEAGGVGALAYSPDGKYLAVGRTFTSRIKTQINLYSAENGGLVRNFESPPTAQWGVPNDVQSLTFSPDSQSLLAHGYGGGAVGVVYDIPTGIVMRTLNPSTTIRDAIRSLAWSPNGQWVAMGRIGGTLELWNTKSWTLARRVNFNQRMVGALAFKPGSGQLALGSFKQVTGEREKNQNSRLPNNIRNDQQAPLEANYDLLLLDVPALSIFKSITTMHQGSAIQNLTFTPDGSYIITGAIAKSVAVNDVVSGKIVVTIHDFVEPAYPAISQDGKFIAASTGREIRLYKVMR